MVRYYDGRFLIYDSETKFKASEITPEVLEELGGKSAVKLAYQEETKLVLPFMLTKSLTDPNNHNLLNWFNNVINNPDKKEMAAKGLRDRIVKANLPFIEEDIQAIVNIPLELDARRDAPVSEKLLDYVSGDWDASTSLRRRIMVDDVHYKHSNKTINQNENTDELGIRLPDADIIASHILGEPYADTPFQGTYNPYPNRLYRMKQIVAILSSATPEIRLEHINRTIAMLTDTYDIKIPPAEVRQLRSAFKILPLDHVLGNQDNDTVDIFDNERPFYENLIDFIRYHIKRFNKEVMVNSTEEEIEAKSEQDFNSGLLPVRLSEYLEQLLYDVLYSNFYHTGNFNYVRGDLENPEDSDASSDADDNNMALIVAKDDITQSDLHILAGNYLTLSAKTFSAKVWAEGIVKLMRWGDRKVKNLNVGLNNTQYLDLQSMNLITQQIADLSKFEVEMDEEGRTLDILAYSYCDFKPQNVKRAQSYPFLLVGREYGTIPGIEEEITVTYITTLFDIVHSYVNGVPTVYDVGFENGKFIDEADRDDLISLEREELNSGSRKIKISDELTEYAIDNNVSKMQGTAFALLRQEELSEFASSEPLLERLGETPKAMRTNVVQGGLLSIFQEGAVDFDSSNLAELLNWYYGEVYPIHLAAYNKLFGFTSTNPESTKLNVKNLPTANFFGQGKAGDEEESSTPTNVKEEGVQFMYSIYEGPQLAFNKIVKRNDDQTLIGGYADVNGLRVFASLDEIKSFAVDSKTVVVGAVLVSMFQTILSADKSNDYVSRTRVISGSTIHDIYRALEAK